MLQMRPNCERCDRDLPADQGDALICSFECTWCTICNADIFKGSCPNCGGDLSSRPVRATALLEKFPASTERILAKPT